MIGILTAMEVERDAIRNTMEDIHEEIYYGRSYTLGTIAGQPVSLVICGVGKVASAIVCAQLIEKYDPQLVINVGVAGGMKAYENTGDVIIAERLTYHDWDNNVINNRPNSFADNQYVFATDEALNQLAMASFEADGPYRVYCGPIVSGDTFVTLKQDVDRIVRDYPEALACDMESTSIAHCCEYYGKKVVIIRSLSDITVKADNDVQFATFAKSASQRAAQFTKAFLAKL